VTDRAPQDPPPSGLDLAARYLVFAQRTDARVDVDAWGAHAARFFATRLGLAEATPSLAGSPSPRTARARVVVAPMAGTREDAGIREAEGRPTGDDDLALADRGDPGGSGLALLARRCGTVWLVTREGADDALALRLAAILSSVLLGPILDPSGGLIGAKTARARLEAMEARRRVQTSS
jgi:hypothetical protein